MDKKAVGVDKILDAILEQKTDKIFNTEPKIFQISEEELLSLLVI